MNKEPSWTEAATKVLEIEGKVWMSVPDLIKALQKTKIKAIDRSTYGQACRNLRSALKHHTRKENGMFAQKQDNMRVLYALRKHVKSRSVSKTSSRTPTPSWPQASNGDAEMSSDTDVDSSSRPDSEAPRKRTAHSARSLVADPTGAGKEDTTDIASSLYPSLAFSTVSTPTTVEIDPAHCKPQRGQRGTESVSPFCLPSPLYSILGPRRTLHMLSESVLPTQQRPVRSVRQKRGSVVKVEEEPVQVNGPPTLPLSPLHSALVGVVCPEEQLSVSTHETDVAFVKTDCSGDPTLVQGDRCCCLKVEFSADGDSSDESDSDEDDDTSMASENGEPAILLQPTPASQLLRRRSLITRILFQESTQRCSDESANRHPQAKLRAASEFVHPRYSHRSYSFAAGEMRPPRKAEVSRIISSLFSSASPLIGENLKLLLNHTAFTGLTESQRREVVRKLPSVDRQGNTQLAEGSLSNSFLSSTLREWQERLASGMFTSEYRTRVRSEEKRRGSVKPEETWKQQYYEEEYGDSHDELVGSTFTPYYPTSENTELHSKCLDAIRRPWDETSDNPSPVAPPTSHASPKEEHSTVKLSSPLGGDQRNHTRSPNIVPAMRHSVAKSQRGVPGRHNRLHAKLNRTFSKPHKPAAKELLKRLKGPPTQHNLSQTIFRSLLTPLPPNTSYSTLLVSLRNENRVTTPPTCQYLPAPPQNHPVFHDHFSLLSTHHVPEEFCEPVTSLPLRIPREHHTACIQCRTSRLEHSYASTSPPSYSVSLPRSLLASECVCNSAPLIYCQLCQSLYHSSCTRTCPGCRA